MKILIASHTYIVDLNREKLRALAKLEPGLEVTVVVPQRWNPKGVQSQIVETKFVDEGSFKVVPISNYSQNNQALLTFGPDIISLLGKFKPDIIQVEQGSKALTYAQFITFNKLLGLQAKNLFFTWWNLPYELKFPISYLESYNLRNTDGIVAGNKEIIRNLHLQNLGIGRGFKAGKESIFSAIMTIEDWFQRNHKKINQGFDQTIYYWKNNLEKYSEFFDCKIIPDPTGNPINRIRIIPNGKINAPSLALALEDQNPSIIVRDDLLHLGYFELDPCNLHPKQEKLVLKGFQKIFDKKIKIKKISLNNYKKIKIARTKNWL